MTAKSQIKEKNGLLPTPPLPPGLPSIALTDNARLVLERRYLRRGADGQPVETVDEMFWRVAYHVAKAEEAWQGDVLQRARAFYHLLVEKRFFPNSPTFTGAGTPLGQLAACFVLPISDDMGRRESGIFQTLRNAALIQQTGGGNGFAFSRLRPAGSLVKSSAGQATGPIGFLRVFDHAFGEIAQGGTRRGANMGVLRVDHPDIENFITCKTDENAITNFNISVGITDAFMQAVAEDADWDLVFPDVEDARYRDFDGTLEQAVEQGIPLKVYKTVKARALFEKIVQQAHHNGEPGLLFLDTANRDNPVPHLYPLESTNPCFVGETLISTARGLIPIKELAESGETFDIFTDLRAPWGGQGAPGYQRGTTRRVAVQAFKTRENAPVLRLRTKMGYTVVATPDHRFLTPERGYVELQNLNPGDKVLLQSGEGGWSAEYALPNVAYMAETMQHMGRGGDWASGHLTQRRDFATLYADMPREWSQDLGVVLGWLVGDGWLSAGSNAPVGMVFQKSAILQRIRDSLTPRFGEGHVADRGSHYQLTYGRVPYEFFSSLGVLAVHSPEKRVPESIWRAPREAVVGFLQGLFSADGTVLVDLKKQDCSVRLASSSRHLLEDVQRLLLNFGIVSRIYTRRPAQKRPMPDGRGGMKMYFSAEQYELVIGKANRDRFAEVIGFIDEEKQAKLMAYIQLQSRVPYQERFEDVVAVVEEAGAADVYDLTEPETHSLIANGLVCHNCGEQFLGPYENCCLGSVNLAQHVSQDGRVDWEKLASSVQLATRFLDDVVEVNAYIPSVPQVREAAMRARRIGLGIMGLADLMYHAGVRYGSTEGQEFAAQVMEFVRYHAMQTSIQLAQERGAFPAIKGSIYDPENLTWQPPQSVVPYTRHWERPALDWRLIVEGIQKHGIRNAAQTTIAPTGTIATVTGCEGYGCEPVFALAYVRHVNDNGKDLELTYASPLFKQALAQHGIADEMQETIFEQVMAAGSCQHVEALPESVRHTFVVASDVSVEDHVRMQAALQAFVDNSISKTINCPADTTPEDVGKAYQLAWELGCKGITVYVTGSREKVVLETKPVEKKQDEAAAAAPSWHAGKKKARPRALIGATYSINTPLGKAFITVNENGGRQPFEVFINTSKAGSETAAVSEAIGRLISYILRLASPVEPRERLRDVVRQLLGIGGGRPLGFGPNRVRSLPDGVGQVLEEYLRESFTLPEEPRTEGNGFHGEKHERASAIRIGDLCPECGEAALVNEEGCRKCYACGYSEC